MVLNTPVMTVEEFGKFQSRKGNRDRRFELVDVKVVEKSYLSEREGLILGNLAVHFHFYLEDKPVGRGFIRADCRSLDDDYNARMPDVSVSIVDRPIVTKGFAPELPAVVVEVQAPDDSEEYVRSKVGFYLEKGSQIVVLVFREDYKVEVYRKNECLVLGHDDVISFEDVLPECRLPVVDIFADPVRERIERNSYA
jgi:Uma2 family endonuclease